MAKSQYYVSESDVGALLKLSGLPADFQRLFVRDYVSLKNETSSISEESTELTDRVDSLEGTTSDIFIQIGFLDSRVDSNDSSIATININLTALASAYNSHAAAASAHGAVGNVVGDGNLASALTAGVVKLASAIASQAASTVVITNTPNAAPVAYVQADAATWVTLLNELKTDVNQLVADLNSLTTKVNSILASDVAAAQRAP